MDFASILRIAGRALKRNKMRSALTMLGIIIGVAAVIAMVAVGQGANEQVQEQLASLGTNMLFIIAGSHQAGAVNFGWWAVRTLTHQDEQAILHLVPTVKAAAVQVQSRKQVIYGNNNWATNIIGTEPAFFSIRNWDFSSGGPFTQQEVELSDNVCVLGNTVVENLFPYANPLGKTIQVGNLPFKIVGTLAPKGESANMGHDQDDLIVIPYTTMQKKITGQDWVQLIIAQAVSRQASTAAQQQITDLLHVRHRILPGQMNDFAVRNLADIENTAAATGHIMTLLLASIASVSLLVGGIGIMNIMLVSVTERTREIGIRMAVGATEKDVQTQFLMEAVVLSAIGGFTGIILGVGGSRLIATLAHWKVDVSTVSILVAVIFSIAIGVFFGYYPAQKAARLDPIEALRYE